MASSRSVAPLFGVVLVACSPAPIPTGPAASASLASASASSASSAPSVASSGEGIAAADTCTEGFSWTKRPAKACLAQNGLELWAPDVAFKPTSESIEPSSFAGLDGVAILIQRYPGLGRIRVEGHLGEPDVDRTGHRLAEDRAQSVRAYLIDRGVGAERLVAAGYGSDKPIADPKTEAGRKLNARIDFVVMAGLRR